MTLEMTVSDLACSVCANKITQAIQAVDPTAQVQADPKTKRVAIATQADAATIRHAIATAGYTVA